MKNSFKISYIINIIIIIISLVLNFLSLYTEKLSSSLLLFLVAKILLLIAVVLTVCCIIFGVINIKNKPSLKKKIILMLSILILLFLVSIILPTTYNTISETLSKDKLQNISSTLTKNIKNENENKYVYLYNDLKKYYNNLKNTDIKENSYITNYNNNIYICLSDGKQKLEGYEDNLELKKINSIVKDCNYDFSYIYNSDDGTYKADGETYLKAYLEDKYNIKISDVVIDFECGLFSCKIKGYDVQTADINFRANAEVNNNKIIVTDNYHETINNLSNNDKIIYNIKSYTLNYLNAEDFNSNADIYDIYWLDDSQITISTTYDKNDAYKYLQSLGEYLKNNNINCNIIINRKIVQNSNIVIDYAMNLIVSNNNFVINQ